MRRRLALVLVLLLLSGRLAPLVVILVARCAGHSDATYLCYAPSQSNCEALVTRRVTTVESEAGGCIEFPLYECAGGYHGELVDVDAADNSHGDVTVYANPDCTGDQATMTFEVNNGCSTMGRDYREIVHAPPEYFFGVYDSAQTGKWSCSFDSLLACEGVVACKVGYLIPDNCFPVTADGSCPSGPGWA